MIGCSYCGGRHREASEVRYCAGLHAAISGLGATLIGVECEELARSAMIRGVERVEAVVAREARRRAAGLTPRGRAPRVAQRPARPLMAPVPAPPPEHPRSRPVRPVTAGPSVDDYRTGAAS